MNFSRHYLQILFLAGIILLSGCGAEPISEVNFENAHFAPFVEPDFPFITTSVDARQLGPGFPEDNIVARGLALRLGEQAYACFDTDMLRWSVAWTGEFLPMVTMAQISYRDFHKKDNQIPLIAGDPKVATGLYPGWGGAEPEFTDPRPATSNPDIPNWGPLPQQIGRWNGIYLTGKEVVMSYTFQDIDIYEKPGSLKAGDEIAFTRTIQIEERQKAMSMVAAEITDGTRSETSDNRAYIYHGDSKDKVTAIGLAGDTAGVEIEVINNRYVVVHISAGSDRMQFMLVMWQGSLEQKELFEQMLAGKVAEIPDFRKGGPAHWRDVVTTRGRLSPDTAAYVTDLLTLPIPNPWNRNVRVVDVAFFESNRAAIVTFEGDVWIVEGINKKLDNLKWRRYASGLYEPQSIEVVRDTVYVYGKEGIVRFHDLNGDGAADYYENFSNLMAQSIETREWASDMVVAPDGSFYIAKFGALDMGPETSSPKSLMGFRAGSQHDGSILNISADGRSLQLHATGFRGPYLGIHPETGVLSASDQQGNYMPSTPVMLIGKGDYYGVPATAHLESTPDITRPLVWIPHTVDRSGISQVWINSEHMGPLNGGMIHLSYGRPGLFRVMIDSTDHGVQGSISLLKGHYPAPTMKGVIGPGDGQLYIAGFSLWGSNSSTVSAFIRIRYTGKESFFPEKSYVRKGGIVIRFGKEIKEGAATEPANYFVKRWNYKRTENYGSGHFKTDGTAGEEYLPVQNVYLSDDHWAVFLAVPDIKEVMQMEVSYKLKAADGSAVEDIIWSTVNEVMEPDFLALGFSNLTMADLVFDYDPSSLAESGDELPTSERGEQLFNKMGCIACHATDGNNEGKIGPGMKGWFGSERHFTDGSTAIANEEYIREAILRPGQKIAKGYDEGMPSFLGVLSDNEIASMTLYIMSLSE